MEYRKIGTVRVVILAAMIVVSILILSWWGNHERPPSVTIYTSVDQPLAGKLFREFERQTGIPVRAVFDSEQYKGLGIVGLLLNEASSPRADVFWSGDPAHSLLLVNRGIVQPYASPNAADIPSEFKSPDGAWTGLAARARVLLVSREAVGVRGMPSSILDLANPRWKGRAAIANPLFGTAAFQMAALFAAWGDDKGKEFLNDLKDNDVLVARSHAEVKGLVVGGEVAFGLLDTDDAAEAMKEQGNLEIVYPDQKDLGTLVIPSTVVLIRGGPNTEGGKKIIDFLLSQRSEQQMVESGGYIPLRPGILVPSGIKGIRDFKKMQVNYSKITDEMGEETVPSQPWLRQWLKHASVGPR
jgi:iron(III) transport system substrate-binding protein